MFDKHGGERLTNGEITTNAVDFILGGFETTANTLAFTAYLTALNPPIQERLRSEIEEYFEDNPVSVADITDRQTHVQHTHIAKKVHMKFQQPVAVIT